MVWFLRIESDWGSWSGGIWARLQSCFVGKHGSCQRDPHVRQSEVFIKWTVCIQVSVYVCINCIISSKPVKSPWDYQPSLFDDTSDKFCKREDFTFTSFLQRWRGWFYTRLTTLYHTPYILQLSFTEKVMISRQLCQGILFMHNAHPPVAHLDLKPETVLVSYIVPKLFLSFEWLMYM